MNPMRFDDQQCDLERKCADLRDKLARTAEAANGTIAELSEQLARSEELLDQEFRSGQISGLTIAAETLARLHGLNVSTERAEKILRVAIAALKADLSVANAPGQPRSP